ncbi:MAG: DeoR/GlpR family DNA-binding transcription regulator [Acidimicrobiales bacterium]
MLAPQRRGAIVERIRQLGAVRVRELVLEFGVSDMTIRRDLEALASRGLVDKVHGGATAAAAHATDEPGFVPKSGRQRRQKEAIAARAAELVRPAMAVGLSAGTTTWALARRLLDVPNLTVVTNSVPVADLFHRSARPDKTVILTGGLRTPSDALVGPFALAAITSLHLDQVFLGVHGMSATAGFTTPNLLEAETNRAFVAAARRVVVVTDHTKWEVVGICTFAALADADVVVTDAGLDSEARSTLASEVGELVVVDDGHLSVGAAHGRRRRGGRGGRRSEA